MTTPVNVTHCAIENCRTTMLNKPRGVSFHPCPKDSEMRKEWLKMLKNKCAMLDLHKSHICSMHFESKHFDALRRLKENAIPTIFATAGPKSAPKTAPKLVKSQNKQMMKPDKPTPQRSFTTNVAGRTGYVSRVPWNFATDGPKPYPMEQPKSKVDRLLNKLTQAELNADIKNSMSKLKEPSDLETFVTDDLRLRENAPKEAILWLMIKKQDHLNNRLMDLVVQTNKHVEILHNNSEEAKDSKRENEQTIESLKYIVKCLQEKHATLEEQIEILTAVESR